VIADDIGWAVTAAAWAALLALGIAGLAAMIIVAVITAVALAVIIAWRAALGVRDWLRRAGRDIDQAIANVCDPCNGKPGTCTCTSKAGCSHPLCGAADTGVSNADFSRELRALLDKEGGRG